LIVCPFSEVPQLLLTFTQYDVAAKSVSDVNDGESLPTGFDVSPDGPSYH